MSSSLSRAYWKRGNHAGFIFPLDCFFSNVCQKLVDFIACPFSSSRSHSPSQSHSSSPVFSFSPSSSSSPVFSFSPSSSLLFPLFLCTGTNRKTHYVRAHTHTNKDIHNSMHIKQASAPSCAPGWVLMMVAGEMKTPRLSPPPGLLPPDYSLSSSAREQIVVDYVRAHGRAHKDIQNSMHIKQASLPSSAPRWVLMMVAGEMETSRLSPAMKTQ